jgi:anti-anti-sigma factor
MDAESARILEEACRSWFDLGVYRLVVDLGELAYLSSMGLRCLLSMAKVAQENGGRLSLCHVHGLVKQVFQITRLSSSFPMYDSLESALAGE